MDLALQGEAIEPVHRVGADHSPDMWYPYLWMLDGDILEKRQGHPSRGSHWFPTFNGTEGVQALEFLKPQVDAGIERYKKHHWGREFANRSFAVMLEGSWLPGEFTPEFAPRILKLMSGLLPNVSWQPREGDQTATLMGTARFAIPETSSNKDVAWEFLTAMVEPDVIVTILKQDGYLPTQIPIGEGQFAGTMRESLSYYDVYGLDAKCWSHSTYLVEYPEISAHIRDAINERSWGQDAKAST